mgnify:CR=1 FL=1
MHPTADTWQTLIIAVTYTAEMGGGEKWQSYVNIALGSFWCEG